MKGLGQDMPYFWLSKHAEWKGFSAAMACCFGLQQVNLDEFTVGNRFEDRSWLPLRLKVNQDVKWCKETST